MYYSSGGIPNFAVELYKCDIDGFQLDVTDSVQLTANTLNTTIIIPKEQLDKYSIESFSEITLYLKNSVPPESKNKPIYRKLKIQNGNSDVNVQAPKALQPLGSAAQLYFNYYRKEEDDGADDKMVFGGMR